MNCYAFPNLDGHNRTLTVATTSTLKVHDAPAASVPPEREIVLEPGVAEIVPPPHEPVRLFGVATTSPAGSVLVNPTEVTGGLPDGGFVSVYVRLVEPPM